MCPARTAEVLTIGTLLGGSRSYVIPPYQREYSWDRAQAERLLEDLSAVTQEESPSAKAATCFLGAISLIDPPVLRRSLRPFSRGGQVLSEIVDGQQRIATLTILSAILRDRLGPQQPWLRGLIEDEPGKASGNGTASRRRLTIADEDAGFFWSLVQAPGATLRRFSAEGLSDSQARLRGVRDRFISLLKTWTDEQLAALARGLRERTEAAVIVSQDIDSGFKTFVSINHPGKGLTAEEILKAELIGGLPVAERGQYVKRWRSMKQMLQVAARTHSSSHGQRVSLDGLLSHINVLQCRGSSGILENLTRYAEDNGGPVHFIREVMEPTAVLFVAVIEPKHQGAPQSATITNLLKSLNWLRSSDWVPVAIELHRRYQSEPEALLAGLRALQRLVYALTLLGLGNERRGARYQVVLEALRAGGPPGFELAGFRLAEDEEDSLLYMLANNLYRGKEPICKCVLAWLEHDISGTPAIERLAELSTEHILPRTPGDSHAWWTAFPDQRLREVAGHSLGNLTLVSRGQNQAARNHDFDRKKDVYFPDGAASEFALTNMLRPVEAWNAEAVLSRERFFIGKLRSAWGIAAKGNSKLERALRRSQAARGAAGRTRSD